ncbi:MAG: helix-turn-helix domain-containing protein [Ruminiclostridium sp.]|nr:helix-turn-helix domain-containing protein [Ruminiclostridium sp.]
MINSQYKSYNDLPLFLNAKTVAEVLGIAQSSAYELMHGNDFPTVKIRSRMVVPKERFIEWVNSHADNPK